MSYPLATSTWDEKEIEAIQKVIAKDMYTMGSEVKQFELNFAEYLDAKYCVMVNSGSSANLLAVAAMFFKKENSLKSGDEVIVPAVSWATTYTPLQQYGLKLKFVDIDRETLNFDLEQFESALTDQTRLVFSVNLLGNCNDFKCIKNVIGNRNITLLEDNCESLGAELSGKKAGTFGLMGTYSTFFSHHMATMEGGMISTDDEELYHILLSLRSHGWTRHLPERNRVTGQKSSNPFEESFKFVLPGYNLRPVEMSGAIGIEQLKKLPGFISIRRKNAEYFLEKLSSYSWIKTQKEIGESSWFGFSMVLDDNGPISRNELASVLSNAQIDNRPIVAGNFVKNEVIKYFNYEVHGHLSNSDYIDQNGLFIGNHQIELRAEIDHLCEVLDKIGR